jgi:hypothetical protein
MSWRRVWTLDAPGFYQGTALGWDARSGSLLVADGWGGAYAALQVRRVDAASGEVVATVRTRRSIRAFGRVEGASDAFYFLGDDKIFVHEASSLTRSALFDTRVPRYANAIADVGGGHVVLTAPNALVELHLATGRSRRIYPMVAVGLGKIAGRTIAVLADGTVAARTDRWTRIGDLGRPQVFAAIDSETGYVASLAGERVSPLDEAGNPQSVPVPTSRELHLVEVTGHGSGEWSPRIRELPLAAHAVGILGDRVVAVRALGNSDTLVASCDAAARDGAWHTASLAGGTVGFAGSHGLVTGALVGEKAAELSLFVPHPSPPRQRPRSPAMA